MASTITYNGVESAQGGNIFKDVRFWLSHRVPMRNHFIDLIKQNGGIVVPLEKNADMLIADDKRKDVPPGSYSWKFIQDSVKNGVAQLKEHYHIGRDPDLPRPVGGNYASKSTRTAFTPADDANLTKWVLAHSGERTGNKIFQEYEKINPRHTWQSWRNRYVKHLTKLPWCQLEKLAASAPGDPNVGEAAPEQACAPQPSHTVVEKKPQVTARQPIRQEIGNTRTNVAETESAPIGPAQPPQKITAEPPPKAPQAIDTKSVASREMFNYDLDEYIETSGAEIKHRHNINGRTIELFDLALAINDSRGDQETQMTDWQQVAETLGFETPNNGTMDALQICYEENLRDFLNAIAGFDASDEEAAETVEEVVDQGLNTDDGQGPVLDEAQVEADSQWPQSHVPSSPPVGITGMKRSAGQRPRSSSRPMNKRRRFHRDEEIPSTPDVELNPQLSAAQQDSPSARQGFRWPDYIDESEASQQLPPLPSAQDESQDLGTRHSPMRDAGITPPAQPQHEAPDLRPIPFSLSKSRLEKNPAKRRASATLPNQHASRTEQPRTSQETRSRDPVPRRTVSPTTAKLTAKAPRRSLPTSFTSSETTSLSRLPTSAPFTRARVPTPRSAQQSSSDQSNRRKIQEWTAHYESLGYPRPVVVEGLRRTTLTPGSLAQTVMQHLKDGKGVPPNYEGIWTGRDDADLAFAAAVDFSEAPSGPAEERQQQRAQKAHNRLVKKHGFARFELRKAFLDAQTMEKGSAEG
ncbi:hypothetical protein FZEAL_4457 [Fusarium zealandicum]|uniref:DNA-binding protein RAP1 n=1 Tax=Fusarium zealandicum TaxID=1053134 RepID=A0A8H4ULP6_9HYPO|nr:hypothetical protein FZEAL_4457 [Fusarium zealandicum]